MIARLVPAAVLVEEGPVGEIDGEEGLLPEERRLVVGAVGRRRREFAAGRARAHRLLALLGEPVVPLLSGADREPLWPDGILGSITHGAGHIAVAVARAEDLGPVRGLGIDVEGREILTEDVARHILTDHERVELEPSHWITAFSAKESVYKAWFPIARCWLGYHDAEVDLDLRAGRFAVRLLPTAPRPAAASVTFAGRVALTEAHVFTAVTAAVDGTAGAGRP